MTRRILMAASVTLTLAAIYSPSAAPQPAPPSFANAVGSPVGIEQLSIKGRKSGGYLVRIRLRDVRIKVVLARNQVGATETLDSMARRNGAFAAINGSYFQAYNRGSFKPPVMNLISDGRLFRQGDIGTMMGFTADNQVLMDRSPQV